MPPHEDAVFLTSRTALLSFLPWELFRFPGTLNASFPLPAEIRRDEAAVRGEDPPRRSGRIWFPEKQTGNSPRFGAECPERKCILSCSCEKDLDMRRNPPSRASASEFPAWDHLGRDHAEDRDSLIRFQTQDSEEDGSQ